MGQIKKHAKVLMTSKDPNSRFNEALASMAYDPEAGTFVVVPGQFAVSKSLPKRPSVRYELKCDKSKGSIIVDDKWTINPMAPWQFTDSDSYLKNVCLNPAAQPSDPSASVVQKRDLVSAMSMSPKDLHTLGKRALAGNKPIAAATAAATPAPPAYPEAIKIAAGNSTVFYQLKDRPTIGVVVLYAMMIDFTEIDFMYQSLETLYQKGVQDIIIDVVGGNGGYANIGPDFAQIFFPNKTPLDKTANMRFRVTPAIQKLSSKVFNSTDGGYSQNGNMFSVMGGGFYDASRFFDLSKNRMYRDNALYRDTVTQSINGRKAVYTKMTTYKPSSHHVRSNLAKYPWTNNPAHLRIVTDGRCLSACANAVYFLANQYKVKSYGIGGTPGQPLSKYTMAAGAAIQQDKFNAMFEWANMTSPLKPLPYQAILGTTVAEIFPPGSKVPLEFDGARHLTDFRMDYDVVNARSREAMWTQVAKDAWKK